MERNACNRDQCTRNIRAPADVTSGGAPTRVRGCLRWPQAEATGCAGSFERYHTDQSPHGDGTSLFPRHLNPMRSYISICGTRRG